MKMCILKHLTQCTLVDPVATKEHLANVQSANQCPFFAASEDLVKVLPYFYNSIQYYKYYMVSLDVLF